MGSDNMDRRTLVEFITAWFLVLAGAIITILPNAMIIII